MYFTAVGLLFESRDQGGDLYMRVCTDGRSQEDLEAILRESGVLTEMRLQTRIAEDRTRVDRALGQRVLAIRAVESLVDELKIELVRRPTDARGEAGQGATSGSTRAKARLDSLPVIRLDCAEAQESLQLAMSSAQAEILISSSRFWPSETTDDFIKLILQMLNVGVAINVEVPADHRQIAKSDALRLAELEAARVGKSLKIWPTKSSHEANFVAVDGALAYLFASSPFVAVGFSSERFGEDRPTAVAGFDNVQEVLRTVHERSAIPPSKSRDGRVSPRRDSRVLRTTS